jgi:hypothetical protein
MDKGKTLNEIIKCVVAKVFSGNNKNLFQPINWNPDDSRSTYLVKKNNGKGNPSVNETINSISEKAPKECRSEHLPTECENSAKSLWTGLIRQ